jgi:hypothetical protein
MKVEIEIKKKDLRSILCAAIRNYYCDVKWLLEPNDKHLWNFKPCEEDITCNLNDIRDACDAISNLCDIIEEVDTVEPNDARGVICFNQDEEEEK